MFLGVTRKIIIDSTVETSLQDEFMLNADGQLEVIKRYKMVEQPRYLLKLSIQRMVNVQNYY